jgi:uncharacterized protein YkwD
VASARPALLAVLVALALGALLGASSGLAASAHVRHARARAAPTHHSTRCARSKHARAHRPGKAGSVHLTHGPSRRHRRGCLRRHHRAAHKHARRRTSRRNSTRSLVAGPDGICQDAELRPSSENIERIRAATTCLVNRERSAHGERPLSVNGDLQQAAQGHTQSMVDGNYFQHVGRGGQTPLDRMRATGYIYSPRIGYEIGENIAWGSARLGTPRAIVAAWMASPGHRANILDARFRDTGVGVSAQLPARAGRGALGGIYTQDFGVTITA